jgi:hypothetical protein
MTIEIIQHKFKDKTHKSIPAREAEMYEAIVPQSIALNPSLARSAFRLGTSTPIPPS